MRRLVLFFVATCLCLLGGGIAPAVPLAPLPSGDVTRIEIFKADHPGPSGEATGVGPCVGGKPTVIVWFKATGTGQVRVSSQRTSDPQPPAVDVYSSELVSYANGSVRSVTIATPLDDSEFSVVIIPGPKDKSGPAHMRLTATRETCEMKTPPTALQPGAYPQNGGWWKQANAIPVWAMLAALILILLRPRR